MLLLTLPVYAQKASASQAKGCTVRGVVLANQKPVENALVTLERQGTGGASKIVSTAKTDTAGSFGFSGLQAGSYRLVAEKAGLQSNSADIAASPAAGPLRVDLILQDPAAQRTATGEKPSAILPMQFADKPNFTVAGITDWTAVGGHGSDSILRTSEALARETLTLKPQGGVAVVPEPHESEAALRAALASDPNGFEANHNLGAFLLNEGQYRNSVPLLEKANRVRPDDYDNAYDLARAYDGSGDLKLAREEVNQLLVHNQRAELHRLAGEIDEKLGNPLAAVHEYEEATRLDPSEENYFEWGSELLYHRAVWQALEVFRQGVAAYPKSSRMLTALGSAQFAGALYDEAAMSYCRASDLDPESPISYSFMGKVEVASPDPLPCVETRLARFVREHPDSSLANYLYAMAILKRHQLSTDKQAVQDAQALLEKSAQLDHSRGEAYLQLGIIAYSRRDVELAIAYYRQAIAAKPQLAESYYRLGVAYDRQGKADEARREFQLHNEIEKKQAAAVDARRRDIKQFMIVQDRAPAAPAKQ
ncbi:MAG TPA: tetratricopeptide repeat protein [Acidobacteriaceae bacterium]|nr:tetratricopeptide repeat protein [Acidobacteriaceae bacterium]